MRKYIVTDKRCEVPDFLQQNLQEEITVTVELTQNMVAENARVAQNQDDYNKRYNALVERYERLKSEYEEVCQSISGNEVRYE